MVKPEGKRGRRAGRIAGRLAGALLIAAMPAVPASAQVRSAPARAAPAPDLPVPDQRPALKMLYGIMAAVDQAGRTGNYTVLRDLGTPAFQANNNPGALAAIFAGLSGPQIDISDTLMVSPVWEISPRLTSPTILRMRGAFPLRPQPIAFDLLFAWNRGWRLDGVAVRAMPAVR
ncbi:MAG: hypothetical protein ACXWU6_05520 [Allosphingosinicella sp.]